MKTYRINLKATGGLTQIPDQQKLFGALIYLYAEGCKAEKVTEFVQSVLHKKFHLALSNVLPEGYLPTPQAHFIAMLGDSPEKKALRSEIKERSYIEAPKLQALLQSSAGWGGAFPYITLSHRQQLRALINDIDSDLYSVPYVIPYKIASKDKEKPEPVESFYFYLQIDECAATSDFIAKVLDAVENKRTLVLGKRASQGLNTFRLCNSQDENFSYDGKCLLLNTGMLLPDDIDYKKSTLSLFTSQRKPFEMPGGWSDNAQARFISFIAEGSIIHPNNGITNAGKSIPSPFDPARSIVFGNAFLYPINL